MTPWQVSRPMTRERVEGRSPFGFARFALERAYAEGDPGYVLRAAAGSLDDLDALLEQVEVELAAMRQDVAAAIAAGPNEAAHTTEDGPR